MSELFIPHKSFSSFVFDEIGKFKLKEVFSSMEFYNNERYNI